MTSMFEKLNPSTVVAFAVDKDRALRVGIRPDLLTIRAEYNARNPSRRLTRRACALPLVSLRSRVSGRLVKGGGAGNCCHLYEAMNSRIRSNVRLRNSRPFRKSESKRQSLTVFRPNVDSAIL